MSATKEKSVLETMNCDLGVLSCSDGSAEFTDKKTSVIVSVNGPMEVRMSKENIEKATVEFLYKSRSGQPSCKDRVLEDQLKSISESIILTADHPRSSLTVVVQEVYDNGGLLAACCNALCLALMDASVPMNSMIAARSCVLTSDDHIIVNANKEQEEEAKATFTIVFETRNSEIISSRCIGCFTKSDYQNAVEKCRSEMKTVSGFIENVMANKFTKYISDR